MNSELDKKRLALRPIIKQATVNEKTTPIEAFQNQTLRPIIKYLNQHILSLVSDNLLKFSKDFKTLSNEKKIVKLSTFLEKNQKIRYQLTGLTIGLMSTNELETYFNHSSEFNKRILKMIEERVIDHLAYFK